MTELQRRMHETVCGPSGLTACLCGAYARAAEIWAGEVGQAMRHFRAFGRAQCFTQAQHDVLSALELQYRAALSAGAGEK